MKPTTKLQRPSSAIATTKSIEKPVRPPLKPKAQVPKFDKPKVEIPIIIKDASASNPWGIDENKYYVDVGGINELV